MTHYDDDLRLAAKQLAERYVVHLRAELGNHRDEPRRSRAGAPPESPLARERREGPVSVDRSD